MLNNDTSMLFDEIKNHLTMSFACEFGNVEVIKKLLEYRNFDINNQNFDDRYLGIASKSGQFEVVKLLIDNFAHINDVDSRGINALEYAVSNGHMEIASYLIKHGANVKILEARPSLNSLASKLLRYVGFEVPYHVVSKNGAFAIEYDSALSPGVIVASGLTIPITIQNTALSLLDKIQNRESLMERKKR